MIRDVSPRALNDSLDVACADLRSKDKEIRELKQKLTDIDNVIRGHYFEAGCKHETQEKCLIFIAREIIKTTGYKPRNTNDGVSQ